MAAIDDTVSKPISPMPRKPSLYPSVELLQDMTVLVEELLSKSNLDIKNLSTSKDFDEFKDIFYTSRGMMDTDDEFAGKDVYLYAGASMIAEAILNAEFLLRNEGVEIVGKGILPDKRLNKIVPEDISARSYFPLRGNHSPLILTKLAGEQMLQGIETKLTLIRSYYNPFSGRGNGTKGLDDFLMEQAEAMAKYAGYAERMAGILDELELPVEAAALKGAVSFFKDPADVVNRMKIIEDYRIYDALLKAHAMILEVPTPSGLWSIIGEHTGEEVSGLLGLERDLLYARHSLDYARAHPKNLNAFINVGGHLLERPMNSFILESAKKHGEATAISAEVQLMKAATDLSRGKGAFSWLEEKITAHGLSYSLLRDIGEYLDNLMHKRTIPKHKRISKDAMYKLLYEKNKDGEKPEDYITAVRKLVAQTVGIEPKPLRYKFSNDDEDILTATAISPIIYRTKTTHDGKIERVQELWCRGVEDDVLENVKKLFPDDDVYVRTNQGAATIAGIAETIGLVYSKSTLIDVRDAFTKMGDDALAKELARLHVDAHEIVHSTQSDSRLAWRDMASGVMEWTLGHALLLADSGKLDRTDPEWTELAHTPEYKRTWRESLALIAEVYVLPALGKGKQAEDMRRDGPFEALFNFKNITPILDTGLNVEALRKLKLEDSVTSKLVKESLDILRNGSVEDIERMYTKMREHTDGLTVIMEHMAESFSTIAVRDYLNNFPDKRYSQANLDDYYRRIETQVGRRGVLALRYDSVMKSAKSIDERVAMLEEKGMRYVKQFSAQEEWEVCKKLISLGYDPLDPEVAYDDIPELRRRTEKAKVPYKDVLALMNGSNAMIGLRYDTDLDAYRNIIGRMGSNEAFKRMLKLESPEAVLELAKKYEGKGPR